MKSLDFSKQWLFFKQGDDSRQIVDLPHDAMIHEQRDPDSAGGSAVAFFPGGVYVYEKTFMAPETWADQTVLFSFDGVYKNSTVFINGQLAATRPYGYVPFSVCTDPFLIYGAENTIRVITDNSQLPNSRWYSGSGIYRPVNLIIGHKTHIDWQGVKISTLSYSPAIIQVETQATGGEIAIEILDGDQVIAQGCGASTQIEIINAKLWSAETPHLYRCHVQLTENGQVVDEVTENFGIRLVEWSNQGLTINGIDTLLRGGCIHHDNGILGACAYARAEERRVRILKEAGYNAIRSSHNPTSRAMLEACDKYGLYVIDETFDMWYSHKNKHDYATDFNNWYLEDTRAMVDRDFNHPAVIMYSIGNEVSEPYQERGRELTREMVDYIHSLDHNRAVTGGINLMIIHLASKGKGIYKEEGGLASEGKKARQGKPGRPKKQQASGSLFFNLLTSMIGTGMNKMANSKSADQVTSPCLDALDIAGYNYASGRYPLESKQHPNRVIFGSETFPQDIFKNWQMVKKYPYIIGDFMWTAWDYLGEAGIGAWSFDGSRMNKKYPWLLSESGAIDILGHVGAEAKYAAVVWGLEQKPYIGVRPMNHPGKHVTKAVWRGTNAIDSWSWQDCDGNKAIVEVYTDADQVSLFVNGQVVGKKRVKNCKAIFKTRYVAGKIEAIAFDKNNKELSRSELVSATGQTSIRIKPEDNSVKAGEIVYVEIDLVGENGVIKSNSDRLLKVSADGGKLLAFGSANPCTEERYDSGSFTTYYGRALAVVRANCAGELVIHVDSDDLASALATVKVIE